MKTELISANKPVITKKGNREMVIVTTASGQQVWVPKAQFDPSAESITYELRKKGEKYTTSDGAEGTLSEDRNQFHGMGRQVIRKYNQFEILDYLQSKGITPTFAL